MVDFALRKTYWLTALSVLTFFVGCESKPTATVADVQTSSTRVPTHAQADVSNNMTEEIRIPVSIEVSGFQNAEGSCRVAIYVGPAHFNDLDFAIAKEVVVISDGTAIWNTQVFLPQTVVNDKKELSLAVSAYHDQNDNQKLDKNSFGIPTERYGFSKDPKRGFGPPKYREASMVVEIPSESDPDAAEPLSIPIRIK